MVPVDGIPILVFSSTLLLIMTISSAVDTMNTTESIRDSEAMVSADGSFKLGFFSPGSSKNRYLGIWYNNISVRTVVWVANREIPLTDSSGVLRVTHRGVLVLLNHNGNIIWSTNSSRSVRNPVAQLLDSGNLVVKDEGDGSMENLLWQSFDYPCDTLLPGMKLGRNTMTGLDRYLSSWKTSDDPSRGVFTYGLKAAGYPEKVLRENSLQIYRSGPWNGIRFSGCPQMRPNPVFTYGFVFTEKEMYYSFQLLDRSILSRVILTQNGNVQLFTWSSSAPGWVFYLTVQVDDCNRYALCGVYGSCHINDSPMCGCLRGFIPKVPKDWQMMNWLGGCERRTPLNCSTDGFRKYSGVNLPETANSWFSKSMNLEECKNMCTKNCSCIAYTNLDIREGGSGCLLWFSDLIDIRRLNENGQDIYIRMAASELGYSMSPNISFSDNYEHSSINSIFQAINCRKLLSIEPSIRRTDHEDDTKNNYKSNKKKQMRIIIISTLPTGMLLLGLLLVLCLWKKKRQTNGIIERSSNKNSTKQDQELQMFHFGAMAIATENFSVTNKLGEGGFGPVYKGILKDGQEIAVKRLSRNSRQGPEEFKNEVKHIAKLQHRNLVKLLGCCIQADERMLIYEFMPNGSLDSLIFGKTRSTQLDWPNRYHIIHGIARGLLYLHQDSRLRIIHRDLKASNILLDNDMNPKISDFGLARSFGEKETEAITSRVVGTYGYISPEYVIDGLYSIKSDVFSFGVLVLEIVSGNKNRGFCHPDHDLNLLGHAWRLFQEGRHFELIPESVAESYNLSEVLRSIHVGLLCVQCSPNDRPSMSSVVLMLCGEGTLPQPKQPGFFNDRNLAEANTSSRQNTSCSVNQFTITQLEAR